MSKFYTAEKEELVEGVDIYSIEFDTEYTYKTTISKNMIDGSNTYSSIDKYKDNFKLTYNIENFLSTKELLELKFQEEIYKLKYLDNDDFESLGFSKARNRSNKNKYSGVNIKKAIFLMYDYSTLECEILGYLHREEIEFYGFPIYNEYKYYLPENKNSANFTLFKGKLKNRIELKKVLEIIK
jgi:hypothetical protein